MPITLVMLQNTPIKLHMNLNWPINLRRTGLQSIFLVSLQSGTYDFPSWKKWATVCASIAHWHIALATWIRQSRSCSRVSALTNIGNAKMAQHCPEKWLDWNTAILSDRRRKGRSVWPLENEPNLPPNRFPSRVTRLIHRRPPWAVIGVASDRD